MSKGRDRHFDEFGPHTQLKHGILRHYLESWVRKLLLRDGAGDRVLLVDACAGEGKDQAGRYGSPVIQAKLAEVAEAQLTRMAGRPMRVDLIAIEQNRRRCSKLRANLARLVIVWMSDWAVCRSSSMS